MKQPHLIYTTLAGFSLIGIGLCLCRFAYTPLIPSMIDADWVTRSEAGFLGGFNFLGYLLGCLAALFFVQKIGVKLLLRVSLVLAVCGLAMCSWDLGFAWLACGRLVTGFAGASLVIQSPSLILQHVPDDWKKVVSGVMFSGAGATIVVVCLMLPMFLNSSVSDGWLFETGLTFLAALIAWPIIATAKSAQEADTSSLPPLNRKATRGLVLLGAAYFLAAISVTPHTLFLTDYLHERFTASPALSSQLFSLLGVGFLLGAFCSGILAKWLGTPLTLIGNYLLGAVAVLTVLLTSSITVITVSAFLIGFFLLCNVPLTSIYTEEISGPIRHSRAWGAITMCFALGAAVGSYGMSALLSLGATYYQLFLIAQVTAVISFGISVLLFFIHPADKKC
ncbi:MAG: YbfB/YjiJ family MFS transporter [Mariniblastus sp.]|nr:YbfB/YjiJ family MFS transporter [Mariniblastus sp.]